MKAKVLQTLVNENSPDIYGPKNVFREAAKIGLIDNPSKWFYFLENRNLSVHTYKKELADKVYLAAKEFVRYVQKLIESVNSYNR